MDHPIKIYLFKEMEFLKENKVSPQKLHNFRPCVI